MKQSNHDKMKKYEPQERWIEDTAQEYVTTQT